MRAFDHDHLFDVVMRSLPSPVVERYAAQLAADARARGAPIAAYRPPPDDPE
jgi:hypothetical protein